MKDFASHCPDDCAPATDAQDTEIERLFALMSAQSEAEEKALNEEAQQVVSLIGHNGGPKIEEPFGLRAPWLGQTTEAELERLAKIEAWIQIKERNLAEIRAERTKIMKRCIRRMRRAEGKN